MIFRPPFKQGAFLKPICTIFRTTCKQIPLLKANLYDFSYTFQARRFIEAEFVRIFIQHSSWRLFEAECSSNPTIPGQAPVREWGIRRKKLQKAISLTDFLGYGDMEVSFMAAIGILWFRFIGPFFSNELRKRYLASKARFETLTNSSDLI